MSMSRSNRSEVFLVKSVLKIRSKFRGEHPRRSVISIKLQNNFIEIILRHRCSPVSLLHIFRTHFTKNTSRWLLLHEVSLVFEQAPWIFEMKLFFDLLFLLIQKLTLLYFRYLLLWTSCYSTEFRFLKLF